MKLLVAGGGTGGHLYPGITVAKAFKKRLPHSDVLFVGSPRDLDAELIRKEGFAFSSVSQKPFPHSFFQWFGFILSSLISFFRAYSLVKKYQPDAVLGMGGFSSVPSVLAAWCLKRAVVLFESNLYPGKANLFLARFVSKVALGYPLDSKFFQKNQCTITGIPVRSAILEIVSERKEAKSFRLLVMGGSKGAQSLNRVVIEAYPLLKKYIPELEIIHLTGKDQFEEVKKEYVQQQAHVEIYPFINEMEKVYLKADAVIARSGASSLAEFALLGLPMILVPYPYSQQDHQIANALYFQKHGAAKVILEDDLSAPSLVALLREWTLEQRREMAHNARQVAFFQATDNLLNLLIGQS